jgi:CheY-like chemotaxis protein
VGNAVKFTEEGEVVLDVRLESLADDEATLHCTVRDTGIGIPEEKLSVLFQVFEQVDPSRTRKYGGTGLGLAISSRLVEQMGGRIWVESHLGEGSEFHFTARFRRALGERNAVRTEPTLIQGRRVLIVDDNATNRRILEEMARSWGMRPATATGVRHALQVLREARERGQPFELVLTDCNMPESDGFSLAEEIRNDSRLASAALIMLTSGSQPGDLAQCERLGIASHLMKPVKQSELFDAIAAAFGMTAPVEAHAESAATGPPRQIRPLRILLAEDSLANQKLAVGLLTKHGHTVVVANHGKQAVAAWDREGFDLILMDVQMPEMDGIEATAVIRTKERQTGRHVPIVAMTAHAMTGDREHCLAAGMDGYIAKPIRASELFDVLERLAGPARESDADPRERAGGEPSNGGHGAIDWSAALAAVGDDPALLEDIVQAFLEECPTLMERVRASVESGDGPLLQTAAHTLKGSLRLFGAERAADEAERLEMLGKSGLLEEAPALASSLQAEVQGLLRELRASSASEASR